MCRRPGGSVERWLGLVEFRGSGDLDGVINHTNVIKLAAMTEFCVRCSAPAGIVMSFAYVDRAVWLDDLVEPVVPGSAYAMCEKHAGRLTPPVGWTLVDRRTAARPLFVSLEVA